PPPEVVRNLPERSVQADQAPAVPDDGPPTAVYAGALTTGRGLEEAIRALERTREVRLRLVGPGTPRYTRRLQDLATAAGVADRVEFVEAVPPSALVDAIRGAGV